MLCSPCNVVLGGCFIATGPAPLTPAACLPACLLLAYLPSLLQGTQQLTVEVPTAISRIALAQRVDTRLAVTALDKGTPGSNGKLRVDLTLSGQLGQKGTRLPITLAGFGRAAWDGEHKTATIRKDRQEITIDGPAGSSEVEVKELSDAVAAGQLQAAVSAWWEKKAEAAAAADGETEAAEEEEKEEAGQIAALLFEAQPEYATVTVAAPVGPLAPGTAADIRRQLWAWLGEGSVQGVGWVGCL